MHNRRFGAFVIGAWLMGSTLMWFIQSQTLMNVERLLATPPAQISRELGDMGPEVSRQLLAHQAMQLNRRIGEAWEIIELGLAAALLATSLLTAHRSKVTIVSAVLMMLMSGVMAFYFTPLINGLSRALDFLPAGAAPGERAALYRLEVWHTTLRVLKMLLALAVGVRLLFDFYEFRTSVLASSGAPGKSRRRRRTGPQSSAAAASGSAGPEGTASMTTEAGNSN